MWCFLNAQISAKQYNVIFSIHKSHVHLQNTFKETILNRECCKLTYVHTHRPRERVIVNFRSHHHRCGAGLSPHSKCSHRCFPVNLLSGPSGQPDWRRVACSALDTSKASDLGHVSVSIQGILGRLCKSFSWPMEKKFATLMMWPFAHFWIWMKCISLTTRWQQMKSKNLIYGLWKVFQQ